MPVLNKMDLPQAEPERSSEEIEEIIGIDASQALPGQRQDRRRDVDELLEAARREDSAAAGRSGCAAAGADHRFLVRQLPRRRVAGARRARPCREGRQDRRQVDRPDARWSTASACFSPKRTDREMLRRRRSGLHHRRHQGDPRRAGGRHDRRMPHGPASPQLPGFKRSQAAGLCRSVSGQLRRLRRFSRSAGKADAERCVAVLRARKLRCAGLRLPLRLPRHAAHGNHPGAAGARIRPRPDHHGADGRLRSAARRAAKRFTVDNPSKLPDAGHIEEMREPIVRGQHPGAAGVPRQRHHPVHRKARRAETTCSSSAPRCR